MVISSLQRLLSWSVVLVLMMLIVIITFLEGRRLVNAIEDARFAVQQRQTLQTNIQGEQARRLAAHQVIWPIPGDGIIPTHTKFEAQLTALDDALQAFSPQVTLSLDVVLDQQESEPADQLSFRYGTLQFSLPIEDVPQALQLMEEHRIALRNMTITTSLQTTGQVNVKASFGALVYLDGEGEARAEG